MGANTYDVVGNILEESVNTNKKAKSKKFFKIGLIVAVLLVGFVAFSFFI